MGFNKNVYGGMIIRFIILINTIMYLNHIELIFIVPFFISMLIFYISYQWVEISIWIKILPKFKIKTG